MSVGEKWFWSAVRKDVLGFRIRRQVAIGPYILDFYIPKAKLCVEIDGEQHAFCAFCGWEDELFAGVTDLDDAGWG